MKTFQLFSRLVEINMLFQHVKQLEAYVHKSTGTDNKGVLPKKMHAIGTTPKKLEVL